jgi:hypothetical protein
MTLGFGIILREKNEIGMSSEPTKAAQSEKGNLENGGFVPLFVKRPELLMNHRRQVKRNKREAQEAEHEDIRPRLSFR